MLRLRLGVVRVDCVDDALLRCSAAADDDDGDGDGGGGKDGAAGSDMLLL